MMDKFELIEKDVITYVECKFLRENDYNFLFIEFINETQSKYKLFKKNNYIKDIIITY